MLSRVIRSGVEAGEGDERIGALRKQENDAYCRTASTFELVKWKCEGLRQQEKDFLAQRTQWLDEMRAKTSVDTVSTESH